jgi:hypothetical protein
MRPIVIAIVVAAAVSAIAGCSTESDTATASSSAAAASAVAGSFCESYCRKINECDSSSDVQTCTETCDDSVTSTLEKLRPEITTEVRTCWDRSDCRQVLAGERLRECVEEAAVSTAPNASAKSFCDAFAAGLDKCDARIDRANCLALTKVYNDATLEQAKKCTSKSCSAIVNCVDATL